MVIAIRGTATEHVDAAERAWVADYRGTFHGADRWATGLGRLSHSPETQQRVFRMSEQLARRGIDRADVFMALRAADRSMAFASDPQAAAEAGHQAITALVCLAEESILICADQDHLTLRAFGFDPIAFDGHDPAAYAWVMFELSARRDAEPEAQPLSSDCHRVLPTAIGLARL
jgi:hypothetical protein